MNPIWLMRAANWIRNPPSPKRIKFMLAIFALCLVLLGIEQIFGWPEALTPTQFPRRPFTGP